nr:carboxyl transferase domain-containing protein [Planosporangium mesophilum]
MLVANRGEVALRILRAARERGVPTVAVFAADEADAPHVALADETVALPASGPAAYLDVEALVRAARDTGCTHLHPGYGFLSEEARFARACADAAVVFVGPRPEVLEVFGDKVAARTAAVAAGVPVLDATDGDASLDDLHAFFDGHPGGVVVKAQSAGGGRGLRVVTERTELAAAYERCAAEATAVSGRASVFAEELFAGARHVEVQVVGAIDGDGVRVLALGDRDCSVQRSLQKVVEIAPTQGLPDDVRLRLHAAAARLCSGVGLTGLGTVEFLVRADRFVFLEVNPRLQVEHPVTEEVTGVDLVEVALAVADGARYHDLDLPAGVSATSGQPAAGAVASATGIAIQCRLNAETVDAAGRVAPAAGRLAGFVAPTGRGVRVETHARPGLTVSGRYDPLLAKIITHVRSSSFDAAAAKAATALRETLVDGIAVNRALLLAILDDPEFRGAPVTTGWLPAALPRLVAHVTDDTAAGDAATDDSATDDAATIAAGHDPAAAAPAQPALGPDESAVRAELLGTIVHLAEPGEVVPAGGDLAVLEAMKMQHPVAAREPVTVARVLRAAGETVTAGTVLMVTRPVAAHSAIVEAADVPLDHVRADLAEVLERHRRTTDEARPDALARLRERGRRTARENLADLVDSGSFVEYGSLALAAQRQSRPVDELVDATPADGLVGGTATVNADVFDARTDVVVLSYDYSVLAGTQGLVNHDKTDRLLDVARRRELPVVLFAEGGGGRPGDTDRVTTGLTVRTFRTFAELRGRVPLVAVVSGRCFAGNAAFAGTCDVIIATPDANLGMGGPAMIEGGGLGRVRPEEIGPVEVQTRNGVIDILTADEAEAVALAKKYLGYFQGRGRDWKAPDPRTARHVVPADRLRAYDVRAAVDAIADVDSVLELRPGFGQGIVTALVRVEGHPLAVLANDSRYLGGAIDATSARKATEFLRLCRDFRLPVLSLCDTPGFMVGPAAEEDASVRRFAELFAAGARLTAPTGMIILRKGYGLGAMAMAMGHLQAPLFTVAWPTGELGPMGLEGAVKLGFRKALEAETDPAARQQMFDSLVALAYEHGKALNAATLNEIDDVIDPADSRRWALQLCR